MNNNFKIITNLTQLNTLKLYFGLLKKKKRKKSKNYYELDIIQVHNNAIYVVGRNLNSTRTHLFRNVKIFN